LSIHTGAVVAEPAWATDRPQRVFDLQDDRGLVCALDVRAGGDARLWGRDRGTFFVAADGSHVRCHPESARGWDWRRVLIGQVLPLAGLVNGFEIVHAAAVAIAGNGVVLAGPSQSGKSSVAAQLVLQGADLLADDVVSVEAREGFVVGHPGTAMIGLRRE